MIHIVKIAKDYSKIVFSRWKNTVLLFYRFISIIAWLHDEHFLLQVTFNINSINIFGIEHTTSIARFDSFLLFKTKFLITNIVSEGEESVFWWVNSKYLITKSSKLHNPLSSISKVFDFSHENSTDVRPDQVVLCGIGYHGLETGESLDSAWAMLVIWIVT